MTVATVGEWEELAERARMERRPLRISGAEYASLVRLKLCTDPVTFAEHTARLFGADLVVVV